MVLHGPACDNGVISNTSEGDAVLLEPQRTIARMSTASTLFASKNSIHAQHRFAVAPMMDWTEVLKNRPFKGGL
jgi:hypothetical protein